jgi:curved DNA-binding protein CbpA
MVPDYYQLLGVPPAATDSDIHAAYRRLARAHHPDVDRSPGAEERFEAISAAYDVLSDPHCRSAYDALRSGEFEANASPLPAPGSPDDGSAGAAPPFIAPGVDSRSLWRSGRLWIALLFILGLIRLMSSFMDGPDDNPAIVLGRSPTPIHRATQGTPTPRASPDAFS